MTEQPHYSMILEWSDEDQVFIVTLPEWGQFAKTHGATYEEAVRNGQEVLQMLSEAARAENTPLPLPRPVLKAS